MTLTNEFVQSKTSTNPNHPIASVVNWKVIPATAIAAGIFYGFDQVNSRIATALAAAAFITAFAFIAPNGGGTSPLGTLMTMSGISLPLTGLVGAPSGTGLNSDGLPYAVP